MFKNALYKGLITLLVLTICLSKLMAQQNKAFKIGEQLKYQIHYGFIRGGEAILTVRESVLEGKTVNNLYLNAVTVGLASVLYQVNDTYQSFTDIETNWPYRSIRDIKENSYKHYSTQTFDHWSRNDSSICNSSITGNIVVVKGCQDILSSVYYLRSMMVNRKPKPDEQFIVQTYFTDEKYPLVIRFKGYEKIKTKYGTIECQKYMPEVITGRVFQSKDDMSVWFSNDNNFIPIRIKLEMYVGAVSCDLIDYKELLYPIVFK
ncbi:MAG: DUF3108 domain-containing protein [Bacteroidales bacterium]|nr:MAG: DUF3108 domain-containing protein [Bacteroidales bacterium]